jgi:hypothetical protein
MTHFNYIYIISCVQMLHVKMRPRISLKFIYANGVKNFRMAILTVSTAFFQITLDFNLVFKSDFECLSVSSECSLQSNEIRFEAHSDDLQ